MDLSLFTMFALLTLSKGGNTVQIRLIENAVLSPLSISNFTFVHNRCKNECLCQAVSQYAVMNYFENTTCQLFTKVPDSYQLQFQIHAHLYLLNETVPRTGQSCTANLTHLIDKLNNTVATEINTQGPRSILIDDHGYLVTVLNSPSTLNRYDPINLTLIDETPLDNVAPVTITFHDGSYYIGSYFGYIVVVNSTTLTMINNITSTYLSSPRDMIFMNNGYTMIVTSTTNNLLVFFNLSDAMSANYIFAYAIPFSHSYPHGLWRVNDSFFYATSYYDNTILSYSTIDNRSWTETLVVDAQSIVSTGGGTHVFVDQYNRLWFSLDGSGVLIYDQQGIFLESFYYSSVFIYQLLITQDCVIYLSSFLSNLLVHLDPQIEN